MFLLVALVFAAYKVGFRAGGTREIAIRARNDCLSNLRLIDGAKQQWARERKKASTDIPSWTDLAAYLRARPTCPSGGTYTLEQLAAKPVCSVSGHRLP